MCIRDRVDGQVYVSYETVRDYLNIRFYWDANENILLYTLPTEMVSAGVGSNSYTVSKETKNADYVILKTEGSTAYIALDFVKQYTDIEYKLHKNPDRVMIVGDLSLIHILRYVLHNGPWDIIENGGEGWQTKN